VGVGARAGDNYRLGFYIDDAAPTIGGQAVDEEEAPLIEMPDSAPQRK
jgi:hypothetical protein